MNLTKVTPEIIDSLALGENVKARVGEVILDQFYPTYTFPVDRLVCSDDNGYFLEKLGRRLIPDQVFGIRSSEEGDYLYLDIKTNLLRGRRWQH